MGEPLPIPNTPRFKNLTGLVFGRLTVHSYAGRPAGNAAHWNCICTCGNTAVVQGTKLTGNVQKSCGCLRAEVHTKHGHAAIGAKSGEYSVWTGMKARCYNRRCQEYFRYGGRGVIVCERWRNSFANFLADMGPRPSNKHSIDRYPNNDGNYEPGNCRWATNVEQQRNRRDGQFVTYNNQTLNLSDWAEITGIPMPTLKHRLKKHTPEIAFSLPYQKRRSPTKRAAS